MSQSLEPHMAVLESTMDIKEDVRTAEEQVEKAELNTSEELVHLDKKILLKLDLSIIPVVCLIYLLAYLDRSNIGNARVVSHTPLSMELSLLNLRFRQVSRKRLDSQTGRTKLPSLSHISPTCWSRYLPTSSSKRLDRGS
jgi:hypothetical protein